MTAGSILLALALLVLVGLFVARPFLKRAPHNLPQTERQLLLEQKEGVLTHILTLDFDHDTGKIPDDVYNHQRAELVADAALLLEHIDRLPHDEATVAAEAAIEAAIAQLRAAQSSGQGMMPTPVARSANGHGRYCTQCGQPTDPDDKFCAHCGQKVATA